MSATKPVSAYAARPIHSTQPNNGPESIISALEEELMYDDHGYVSRSDSGTEGEEEATTPRIKKQKLAGGSEYVSGTSVHGKDLVNNASLSTLRPTTPWVCGSTWRWTTTSAVSLGNGLTAVVMQGGDSLSFVGYVEMAVACGSVEIHGAVVTAHGGPLRFRPLFSPKSMSVMSINALSVPNPPTPPATTIESSDASVFEKLMEVIEANVGQCAAVAVFREPGPEVKSKATSVTRNKHYRNILSMDGESDKTSDPLHISTARLVLTPRTDMRSFVAPPLWFMSAQEIATLQPDRSSSPPVVLICGGKNVGKSSFVRYLVNTLLHRHQQVAHLECDVGQGEFTPPGIVSLTICTEPILGPPAFHQRNPEHARYYGDSTARKDPMLYLACVASLVRVYRQVYPSVPLVVNTHGWIKGMGVDILHAIAAVVDPTYTVQFTCPADRASHFMAPLTPDLIRGAHERDTFNALKGCPSPLATPKSIVLDAVASVQQPGALRAADFRNMALSSYFHPETLHCYSAPFSAVALAIMHEQVPRSQYLYSLNASMVALLALPSSTDFNESRDASHELPRFLDAPTDANCLGLGFVRNIDTERRCFSICTPLLLEQAENVRAIVKGAIELPQDIDLDSSCAAGVRGITKRPYTMPALTNGLSALGASARSSRSNLLRRKNG